MPSEVLDLHWERFGVWCLGNRTAARGASRASLDHVEISNNDFPSGEKQPDNNVWSEDWIRSCSSAPLLALKQEVKWGVGVPIITQQLPPSETWPIKKRVRDGDAHTPTRCLGNADASSGHGSILVAAWERRPAERHCNAWRGGVHSGENWTWLKCTTEREEVTGGHFPSCLPPSATHTRGEWE